MVDKLDGVNPDKVHDTLEALGDGFQSLDKSFTGAVGWVDEEVGERKTLIGVRTKVLGCDLVKKRNRVELDKVLEIGRGERRDVTLGVNVVTFVKLLVENNGREGRRA